MNLRNTAISAKKLLLDPGVVFQCANIFAFIISGNLSAVIAAMASTVVVGIVSYSNQNPLASSTQFFERAGNYFPQCVRNQFTEALRVNGWSVLIPTLIIAESALAQGISATAILPMIAGTVASGSFVATSTVCKKIQTDSAIGWLKAITNPAVHWSIGYTALGLAAGGGLSLFAHISDHIPALVMTSLGIATTTSSAVGLTQHKFSNPASPFMTLVHGTDINAGVALFTGNFISVANMLCAGTGEFLVGMHVHRNRSAPVSIKAGPDTFFRRLECYINWPLRLVDRYDQRHRAKL